MSAASGEPEVQRYDMGWNADAHDDIVPCEFGTFVRYADYLTLAQQRGAAVRERAECVAREQRWMARLAACEGVVSTGLAWFSALQEYEGNPYTIPRAHTLYNAQEAHREALRRHATPLDDDDGPNDGHARTVRRSAKQDAATTRGEG